MNEIEQTKEEILPKPKTEEEIAEANKNKTKAEKASESRHSMSEYTKSMIKHEDTAAAKKAQKERERKAKEDQKKAERSLAILDIKTNRAKEFKDFIIALGILDEFNFTVDKTGLHIFQMDPSGIAMVIADLPRNFFFKWDVKEGTISISAENLIDALKPVKKNDTLSIKTEKTERQHLMKLILPHNVSADVPYMPVQEKRETKVPPVKPTAEITIPGKPLKDFLSQAKKYDYMLFLAKGKKLILFCKGDAGKLKKEILLEKPVKESAATFNIKYLKKMVRAINKDTNIKMGLKTEEPVKIAYGAEDWAVGYWLAPYQEDPSTIKELIKEAIKSSNPSIKEKEPEKKRLHA